MSALDWPGLESLEFDAPQRAFGCRGDAPAQSAEVSLLHSPPPAMPPALDMRARLQVICGLYAHARTADQRAALLERMEAMTLEVAHILAIDLLRNGWRPD